MTLARGLLGLLLLLALAAPAGALEFEVMRQSGRTIILASGPFTQGDAGRLDGLLRRTPNVDVLVFRSPGGVAVEGLEVGRVIRKAGLATHLPAGTVCASACTFAFLGGRVRTMDPGARYGVHLFSMSGSAGARARVEQLVRGGDTAGAIQWLEQESARFAAQLAYYAVEMGVSLRLLAPNFSTAFEDIRWLTARELRDLNVVNAD